MKLLIENNSFSFFDGQMRPNHVCLGTGQSDMLLLTNRYKADEVGLLLDVAHAQVCANTLNEAVPGSKIADRIEWLHLSDCSQYVI